MNGQYKMNINDGWFDGGLNLGKGDYACCLCATPVFHLNDFKIGEVYGTRVGI